MHVLLHRFWKLSLAEVPFSHINLANYRVGSIAPAVIA
jgi:hypothetical protein